MNNRQPPTHLTVVFHNYQAAIHVGGGVDHRRVTIELTEEQRSALAHLKNNSHTAFLETLKESGAMRLSTAAKLLQRLDFQIAFLRRDVASGNPINPKSVESFQQTHDEIVRGSTDCEAVKTDAGDMLGVMSES